MKQANARQECELKFRVDGSRAFDALAAAVGAAPTPAVRQVNHFFDTAGLSLRRTKHTLRVRDEAGALTITAKGPQQAAAGVLTRRPEEEVTIDRPTADAILRGERSPLSTITQLAPPAARELLAAMSTIVGGDALVRIGAIENERARLSAALVVDGAPIALQFEMDCTTFPGGHVDYEVEVELDDATADAASAAVMKLLADAGIGWQPATSKAERFFDIVARSLREPSP